MDHGYQYLDGASDYLSSLATARLAQSAERKALNLVVVGSSPTVGAFLLARINFHFPEKQAAKAKRRMHATLAFRKKNTSAEAILTSRGASIFYITRNSPH